MDEVRQQRLQQQQRDFQPRSREVWRGNLDDLLIEKNRPEGHPSDRVLESLRPMIYRLVDNVIYLKCLNGKIVVLFHQYSHHAETSVYSKTPVIHNGLISIIGDMRNFKDTIQTPDPRMDPKLLACGKIFIPPRVTRNPEHSYDGDECLCGPD
jgi:hypothetical protein